MKRFQSIIQKYVTNHQKHKKYLAAVLALSILVSFAVPLSLIMPAISMTESESPQADLPDYNDGIMTLSADSIPADSVNVTEADTFTLYIVAVYDDEKQESIYSAEKKDGAIIGTPDKDFGEVEGDELNISFELNYSFSDISNKFPEAEGSNRYMIVEANNINLIKDYLGETGDVRDKDYTENAGISGTYKFKNGYILIEFNQDYIDWIYSGSGNLLGGTLNFEGNIKRDENGNGQQNFEFAGEKVDIKFSSNHPTVTQKYASQIQNGKIEWTVTIDNSNGTLGNGYTLSDLWKVNGGNQENSIIQNVEIGDGSGNPITDCTVDENNGTIIFSDACKSKNPITIKYTTSIENLQQGDKVENTATLTKDGDSKWSSSQTSEKTLTQKPVEVSKSGTPDYNNGTIKWTITVTSNYGESLNGYQVIDDAFNNGTLLGNVTVNGSVVIPNGDTLTLSQINGNVATIEYETSITDGVEKYDNHVEVKKDNEKKDETDATVTYKKWSELVGLSKYGSYSEDTHEVEWTITITPENNYYLNGYVLTDSQFPNELSKFDISCGRDKVELISSGTLKFKDDSNVTGTVTIKYKTSVTLPDGTQTTAVANDIGDNHHSTTTVATVTIKARNSVSKNAIGDTNQSVTSSGTVKKEIGWNVSITSDGKFAGKTYTDTLSVVGDGAKHTIDKNSAGFELKAKSTQYGSEVTLTEGTDYTIKIADDGKSFEINFKDDFDSSNTYNYVYITYNTIAELGSDYAKYQFKNDAGFNGATAGQGQGHFITRDNPIKTEKMSLNVVKNWDYTDDSDKISVTFKLQYRTGAYEGPYEWKDVHVSGEDYIFETDANYNSSNAYTITLDSSQTFKTWLSNLPKKTTETKDNGGSIETNYYYRVLEKNPDSDEYFVSNGYFIKSGKLYSVTYNDDKHGINYDNGSVTVTNRVYKNININPFKKWKDNSGTDIIDNNKILVNEITIELQRRSKVDGNWQNWDSAETIVTSTLTKSGDWEFSDADKAKYKNLPLAEVKDGKLVEYEYRVVETKYDDNDIKDRNIVDNGYFEVTSNNSTITSDSNFEIVNKLSETKDQTFSVEKTWDDEDVYGVDYSRYRPSEITFELQRQTNNSGSWETLESYTMSSKYNNLTQSFEYDNLTHEFSKNYPTQKITSDGTVTKYDYRVVETGYKFNDETVKLASGTSNFITSGDGYWTIETTSANGSSEVAITNRFVPYPKTSVKPQKKWADDAEFTNNRKNVKLRLQWRTDDNAEWEDYKDSNDKCIEVELTSDNEDQYANNTWNGNEIPNLPKSTLVKSEVTENGEKKIRYESKNCQYRFAELGDDGASLADGASFKAADGRYTVTYSSSKYESNGIYDNTLSIITNTFKKDVGITKHLLGDNGSELPSSIDIEELKQFKHGDYYIFNWAIRYDLKDWTGGTKLPTIKDILPEGFELCTKVEFLGAKPADKTTSYPNHWGDADAKDAESTLNYWKTSEYIDKDESSYFVHPSAGWISTGFGCFGQPIEDLKDLFTLYKWNGTNKHSKNLWYYYDTSKNEVYFNKFEAYQVAEIYYAIKIKCTDLDAKLKRGTYTITNTAYTYDDNGNNTGNTVGSLTIVNNIPTGLIAKDGTEYEKDKNGNPVKSLSGYYNFSIDVNPEGKNLSNGDTIDIEDIFKTTGYFDNDKNGGYWEYGDKLVDILMNKITISEVDANGNKTALNKSEYVLKFDNSASVEGGTALMKLTVPDEKHLVIDYTYKMIANANTPSVKNGCKSDIKEKGKRITMVPGLVPPGNDKISFKNTVSLKSDSVSDTADFTENEYEFFTSNATSYTNKLPKIIKVNTGNTSINNLMANFFIAQYNQSTGKWKYATKIEKLGAGSSKEAKITEWSEEYSGSYVPDNAAMIDVQTEYQIEVNLSQNALYKLVEVKVPEGYEGSNLHLSDDEFRQLIVNYLNNKTTSLNGKDYDAFLKNYVNTHYFVYNSVLSSYPDGIEAKDVIQVKQGEDVEIPNNQLINIGVGKEWNDSKNDDDSITVQLYWSYTKNTAKIPIDAKVATATELGIMDTEFNAEKTLKMNEFNVEKIKESVWTDLPNGKDGKPIYYYIKETAYTIEGVTYTLDESDGAYKNYENKGAYYPIYVGNAANVASSNGTPSAVVQIKNTKNLVLKKAWKDSNNQPLTKGVPDSIIVSIYGTDKDTNEEILLFENIELSGDAWEANITDKLEKEDGTTIDLSQYKSFRAEETGINADDYTISCVFNLNSNSGEITVTNKSKKAISKSVTVDKVWSDGADVHKNDSIKVSLYRSTKEITGLTGLNQSAIEQKINDAGAVKMTDTADVKYTVNLNSNNGWSYTWTGLPMDDGVDEYFYYVLENMNNVKAGTDENLTDKYAASYTATINGAKTTFTVKNTRSAIKVQKEWYDAYDELIPNEFIDEADGSVTKNEALEDLEIELTVSKKVNTNKPNPMVIHTFGDSITYGNGYNESNATYASDAYLGQLLESSDYGSFTVSSFGWNISDSTNTSGGGEQISYLNGKTLNERDNVVCIMLGTNNIIQNTGYGLGDTDLKAKIVTLLGNPESDDYTPRKLFLASVPNFNYTSDSSAMPTWSEWTSPNKHGFTGTKQEIEDKINNVVAGYNSYVESVVTELKNAGYDAYFVDVNAVINKDTDLCDGCHLNKSGVNKMAKAFAEAINSSYTVSDTTNSKTVTLNSGNNWTAVVDVDDDSEYYVTETKVTLNGENVTDDWIASYENNGQKAESQTPVTIKNKKAPVPTKSVSIKKTWQGDNATSDALERAKIKLELWRTTTPNTVDEDGNDTWEYYKDVASQPICTENVWTYTCDNLPAVDNLGREYYYKVVELDMDSYTVSYDEINGITSGTLHVTNTRTISLKFKKIWSDSETVDHTGDTVKINVYRSTNSDDVPGDKLPQMLKVPENVSIGVGKSTSVNANKDISIISVEPNDVITASAEGRQISIKGNKQGTATITVKDESGETAMIIVTVSALEIILNDDFTIEAGATGELSAKLNDNIADNVTFSSSDENVISVNGKTITAHKLGTAEITATVGDVSVTQTIEVILPSDFIITGDSEVTMGNKINLGIDKNYGTFTWSSSNDSIATVDQNGKVTGVSAGEVTITATRNGDKQATKTITVKNGDIAQDGVVITLRVGETVTLISSLGVNGSYSNHSIIDRSVDTTNGTITITALKAGEEDVTFQDKCYKEHNFKVIVLDKFSVSPANTTLAYGQSVELKPNQSVNKYDIISGGDLISISGNTVTANTGQEGTATIRATNNSGETSDITINVVEKLEFVEKSFNSIGDIKYDKTKTISSVVLNLDSSNSSSWPFATIKFDDNNYVKVGYSGSADSFGLDSNGGYKLENINVEIDKSAGNATITFKDDWQPSDVSISNVEKNANGIVYIYYGSASTQSYSMRSAMRMASSPVVQAEAGSEDQFYCGSVELSASTGENWTATLDNLDVYDSDGKKYYYWAVEDSGSASGYTASYYFDDSNDDTKYCIDATQLGSGEITIKNTKNESPSVEMPSTGGKGVKWHYVTGMAIMFVSVAGILIRRRKNPVK